MLLAQQNITPLVEFSLDPLWQDHGIPLAVMGMLVVFMALIFVVMFITFLPRILALVSLQESEDSATASIVAEEEISEEIQVVIAAAVAEMISHPHRVMTIRGVTPAEQGWSLEGRVQQHQSHKIRRRGL